MPKKTMQNFFINAFYESKFKDKLFVVKASGQVIEDDTARRSLIDNIKYLTHHGIKVLLVYGGGAAIDEAMQAKNMEPQKYEGRRITDAAIIEIMKEVVGGRLALSLSQDMAAISLEGIALNVVPAEWMDVTPRPKKPVDFGFVGDIEAVHPRPINRLFRTTNFVCVPCLALMKDGTMMNINADTIATELAIGVAAHKLIFLSNVDGVQVGGETALMITTDEIPGLIKKGIVTGGMQVKMESCTRALESGVKRIHLLNGLRDNALKNEIFEPVSPGTMIMQESERPHYINEIEVQKAIGGKTS